MYLKLKFIGTLESHRSFHHSAKNDKKTLITDFYSKRIKGLKARGIYLTLKEMHNYYGC
jgi:hypothetical protein